VPRGGATPTGAPPPTGGFAHHTETGVPFADFEGLRALLATLDAGRVAKVTTATLVERGRRVTAPDELETPVILPQLERRMTVDALPRAGQAQCATPTLTALIPVVR
jgi:hypothetical protein